MSRAKPLRPATTVAEATATVTRRALALPPLPAASVPVADADGRVLAEPVLAAWDLPAADVSMMDGWAVNVAQIRALPASGSTRVPTAPGSAAGHPAGVALPEGAAARVFTGAVVPAGADAVIPQEDVEASSTAIAIDSEAIEALTPGRFVRRAGSEVRRGDTLLPAGTRLGPPELAALASAGVADVAAYRRPTVAIVSTGDELVPIGSTPGPGQIVSSNGLMLAACARAVGAEPILIPDADDDDAAIEAALRQALRADIVVTSGGISVGDHDRVRPVLEALGTTILFHGLALRPGKPAAFGHCDDRLVFALPGNPASTWVTFLLLVRTAIVARSGERPVRGLPTATVTLTAPARGAGNRTHYVRGRWAPEGGLRATPLSAQRSGNLGSITAVDVLLIVPVGVPQIDAGQACQAVVLRPPAEHEG